MLGISVYLQDLDVEYIQKASQLGVEYVFTSLHIPEEDFSDIDEKLPLLLKTCEENGLSLVPDVSPGTFQKLGIELGDITSLKKMGLSSLRLDYGFDDLEEVKKLQEHFLLMLNASTVDEEYLLRAKAYGIDLSKITMAHNFYPKTDTALSTSYFAQLNEVFFKYEMDVLTFVPGDLLKRFPLYEGLPTIEKHRGVHPFVAAVELIQQYGISDIMIGDSFAKLNTLEKIKRYMTDKTLTLPVSFIPEFTQMYNGVYEVRKDMPQKVIRLGNMGNPRIPNVPIATTGNKLSGTITMENKLAGRYSGEIQICKEDLPISPSSNIIGFVHPEYVDLLQYVDSYTKILFVSE